MFLTAKRVKIEGGKSYRYRPAEGAPRIGLRVAPGEVAPQGGASTRRFIKIAGDNYPDTGGYIHRLPECW